MYLGVDGGGTKTAFALIDGDGALKASHVGASIDYLADGIAVARARLIDGIRATLARRSLAPAGIAFAFFGLPAYGEDGETIAALDAMPSELLEASHYRCGNDMVCSWAGSLACTDGISVIAGTGSMAYGEFAGRQARCGGWGELIGDEGSAYWIAREGMNLFSRMSDGRVARGPLHRMVRERLELTNDLYLCSRIYGAGADRRDGFAQFARLVHDAAQAGDAAAAGIFTRGAKELVDCVIATRRALDPPAKTILPVSHSGGVFNNAPEMVEAFRAELAAAPYPLNYLKPIFPPAVGAALYAARIAGKTLNSAAVKRLQQQCESSDVFR